VSYAQELNDSKKLKDIVEILNHLKLYISVRVSIDLLNETIDSLEEFLEDIIKLSGTKKNLDTKSIDELFTDK
jgi:hypothetical protein